MCLTRDFGSNQKAHFPYRNHTLYRTHRLKRDSDEWGNRVCDDRAGRTCSTPAIPTNTLTYTLTEILANRGISHQGSIRVPTLGIASLVAARRFAIALSRSVLDVLLRMLRVAITTIASHHTGLSWAFRRNRRLVHSTFLSHLKNAIIFPDESP